MRLRYTDQFRAAFAAAPPHVQQACLKQARFLRTNLRYPSLRAKKYDERRGIWQARVTKDWRFYFLIEGDSYVLLDLMAHPK